LSFRVNEKINPAFLEDGGIGGTPETIAEEYKNSNSVDVKVSEGNERQYSIRMKSNNTFELTPPVSN
jgi:hypothetical protein